MTNNKNHKTNRLIGMLRSHAKDQYIEQHHMPYMSSISIDILSVVR